MLLITRAATLGCADAAVAATPSASADDSATVPKIRPVHDGLSFVSIVHSLMFVSARVGPRVRRGERVSQTYRPRAKRSAAPSCTDDLPIKGGAIVAAGGACRALLLGIWAIVTVSGRG